MLRSSCDVRQHQPLSLPHPCIKPSCLGGSLAKCLGIYGTRVFGAYRNLHAPQEDLPERNAVPRFVCTGGNGTCISCPSMGLSGGDAGGPLTNPPAGWPTTGRRPRNNNVTGGERFWSRGMWVIHAARPIYRCTQLFLLSTIPIDAQDVRYQNLAEGWNQARRSAIGS